MGKKIVLLIVLLIFFLNSFGQNITFLQSDADTYQKYIQQDWKAVIKAGKSAKKNSLDYYYLNVRMGIAYFKLGKYMLAIPYFEKANAQNPTDEFVLDYLYYSYLYSGNEKLSLFIYSKMSNNLRKNKNISSTKLKDVNVNSSYHFNQNYDQLATENYLDSGINNVIVNLNKSTFKIRVGLNYQTSPKKFLYQMFDYTRANVLNIEQNINDFRNKLSINEFRYYGKVDFLLGNRWTATLNYNLLFGTYENLDYNAYARRPGSFNSSFIFYGNVSTGFSITKQWKRIILSPHANILAYNGANIFLGTDLILYPLGNTDLYLRTDFSYNPLSTEIFPFVIKGEAGFRIWKLYFTGTYYHGTLDKFVENDGLFVYNFDETVLNQSAFSIQFFNNNKTYYASVVPSSYEMFYSDVNSTLATEYSKTYDKYLIKFGIKWKLSK